MRNPENEQLLLDFYEEMGPTLEDCINAYRKYVHPDFTWCNSGFPEIKGVEAAIELLKEQKRLFGFEGVRLLANHNLISMGDMVVFERKDSLANEEGTILYEFDILGIFKIKDGKILEWRDYMDTSIFRDAWASLDPDHKY